MLLGDQNINIPRVGEIVIVSCSNSNHWSFLRSICDECEITEHDIALGRTKINEDLDLFLYGLNANNNLSDFAWDLLVHKMMGYIVLYDWYDYVTFSQTKKIIDFLTDHIDAPFVIAADVHDQPFPIPPTMFKEGIPISSKGRFTFCCSSDAKNVKDVLRMLCDILLSQ